MQQQQQDRRRPAHGIFALQGLRDRMEDVPTAVLDLAGCRHLFAVFDGHGGRDVAEHCSAALPGHLSALLQGGNSSCTKTALHEAIVRTDKDCCSASSSGAGSTAVVALLSDEMLWVAHCGDSRAVLCRSGGRAVEQLTEDHKPSRRDERDRVLEAGGVVFMHQGCLRVMGVLAVTRAIGNHDMRRCGITAEPEVREVVRTAADEFLIIASDGLWDVMSNQEAVDLVNRCVERCKVKAASRHTAMRVAAKVLAKQAVHKGSTDNVSVVVVDLAQNKF